MRSIPGLVDHYQVITGTEYWGRNEGSPVELFSIFRGEFEELSVARAARGCIAFGFEGAHIDQSFCYYYICQSCRNSDNLRTQEKISQKGSWVPGNLDSLNARQTPTPRGDQKVCVRSGNLGLLAILCFASCLILCCFLFVHLRLVLKLNSVVITHCVSRHKASEFDLIFVCIPFQQKDWTQGGRWENTED